jgi:hypothetical protein
MARSRKHNGTGTRLYEIWKGMRKRCYCSNRKEYKDYGAKGVRVCSEWDEFPNFRDWAMENGYADDLSIDRINPYEGYSPQNCRWVTRKEQENNKRNSVFITFNGETKTVTQWAETYGFKRRRLYYLITKEASPEKALEKLI